MKRREVKGSSSTDLLVCFPTRSHLTLTPKTICSPSRRSKSQNLGKSIWCKKNHIGSELSEPTSPKVTCAGQIKAPSKSLPCKNWQSVMEEIERLHKNKKHRKKATWGGTLGFKKESMQFLTCLRSFKFDMGCFGIFPNAHVTSDDDEEEEINHENKQMGFRGHDHDHDNDDHDHGSSRSAFAKFFMVLEKNRDCGLLEKEENDKPKDDDGDDDEEEAQSPCMPPSDALLLMRCRSAPAKSWLEEREEKEQEDDDDDDDDDNDNDDKDGEDDDDVDYEMKRENLLEVMKYDGDFYKLSCDIARETWVVGGINNDSFSRTQSSKRCSTECLEEVKACLR